MIYLNAFIFAGLVCALGQIILDTTKLTPGLFWIFLIYMIGLFCGQVVVHLYQLQVLVII